MASTLGGAPSPLTSAAVAIPTPTRGPAASAALFSTAPLLPSALRCAPPSARLFQISSPLRSPLPSASRRWKLAASPETLEVEAAPPLEAEPEPVEVQLAASMPGDAPKGEEVFAVVMIGSRQYIVFPGRFLYVQRLKDANVNDKITLNKVLLVGTRTKTYIGEPIVTNAAVHAVVEEQGLDKKVIVYKYKKKKNYRRNIGHRQPNTRIRIMGISGYEDFPFETLPVQEL